MDTSQYPGEQQSSSNDFNGVITEETSFQLSQPDNT
jgi:hypothetical protein